MEQYQCHKVVRAGKISHIVQDAPNGWARLLFHHSLGDLAAIGTAPVAQDVSVADVSAAWIVKHAPAVDGYYVLYEDGYASYSPAAAFEAGYARLSDMEAINREQMARACHEVNAAYCQALGDTSQLAWDDAPEWQRESARNGVAFHLANPDAGPDHSHNEWLKEKEATGWKYGPVKDVQKAKDYIFRAVVHAFR